MWKIKHNKVENDVHAQEQNTNNDGKGVKPIVLGPYIDDVTQVSNDGVLQKKFEASPKKMYRFMGADQATHIPGLDNEQDNSSVIPGNQGRLSKRF